MTGWRLLARRSNLLRRFGVWADEEETTRHELLCLTMRTPGVRRIQIRRWKARRLCRQSSPPTTPRRRGLEIGEVDSRPTDGGSSAAPDPSGSLTDVRAARGLEG